MKKIQVIAVDLDGTLMNERKELTPGNRAAMEAALRAGVTIVPTTGRPYSGIPQVLRDFPGLRYAITANGAAVYRMTDGACLYERALPDETAQALVAATQTLDVVTGCFIGGQGYMDRRSEALIPRLRMAAPVEAYVRSSREVVPEIGALLRAIGKPVQKITLYFCPDTMAGTRAEMQRILAQFPGLNAVSGGENSMEISAAEAAKGNALRWLAAELGKDGTMAIGDTENDLDMIRKADLGVAMANSEPVLLAEADAVTGSNREDGVAQAIYRYVPEAGSGCKPACDMLE